MAHTEDMTTSATSGQANRARAGNGRFRRDLAHVERDAEACRLASRGLSYAEIAQTLGYTDKGSAYRAVQKVLRETAIQHGTEELRQKQLAEIAEIRQRMWRILDDPPPAVDRLGRPVRDAAGEPVVDAHAQVEAAAVLLRALERQARLTGTDAPKRSVSWQAVVEAVPAADLRELAARVRSEAAALERDAGGVVVAGAVEAADS
jgi:hypothetical protein